MTFVLAAVLGYLLGAVPFGLLVGRLVKGIDLREYGSHRTGATNALRTLGTRAAAAVFVLDVAKGVVAVLLARLLIDADPHVEWGAALAGFAAIVGHNWSVFIRFTGGRGVATSAGALGAMSPITILVLVPIVIGILLRSRYVSLGSIVGGLLAPIIAAILAALGLATVPGVAYALASGLLVTAAHADNIGRLRAGTERKIGQKEEVRTDGGA
ncbi:MAG: glycerol-3-phosphate 1-O-acyltransferase PlsY [Candidatus Limnocylindria bacterium]